MNDADQDQEQPQVDPAIKVDKYQAAYLQQINDEGNRLVREQKDKLIAALNEVREDCGAPPEYIYDGVIKAFKPAPARPVAVPPLPEPEGGD